MLGSESEEEIEPNTLQTGEFNLEMYSKTTLSINDNDEGRLSTHENFIHDKFENRK